MELLCHSDDQISLPMKALVSQMLFQILKFE